MNHRAWCTCAHCFVARTKAIKEQHPLEKYPVTTPQDRSIYVIGSLRNPRIPEIGNLLRAEGWDAFDDWYSAGPEADDKLWAYEKARGRDCVDALKGFAARNAFEFDKRHIDRCARGLLVMPAGKSGHLELGYMLGKLKPGYILLDGEPERIDLMMQFATAVFRSTDEMLKELSK